MGSKNVQNRDLPRRRVVGIARKIMDRRNVLRSQRRGMPVERCRMHLFPGAPEGADDGQENSHIVADYKDPLRMSATHRICLCMCPAQRMSVEAKFGE